MGSGFIIRQARGCFKAGKDPSCPCPDVYNESHGKTSESARPGRRKLGGLSPHPFRPPDPSKTFPGHRRGDIPLSGTELFPFGSGRGHSLGSSPSKSLRAEGRKPFRGGFLERL